MRQKAKTVPAMRQTVRWIERLAYSHILGVWLREETGYSAKMRELTGNPPNMRGLVLTAP